jgi:hypothetical protein
MEVGSKSQKQALGKGNRRLAGSFNKRYGSEENDVAMEQDPNNSLFTRSSRGQRTTLLSKGKYTKRIFHIRIKTKG